ncbi:MAG: hypothetical protein FDZ75_01720 [Actinobacteria bacterium]|nr:MAG: hypothetical protein FDZ75_01720 [Actinomycetota bacterium]
MALLAFATYAAWIAVDNFNPVEGFDTLDPTMTPGEVQAVSGIVEGQGWSGAPDEPWLGTLSVRTGDGRDMEINYNAISKMIVPSVSRITTGDPMYSPDMPPYRVCGLPFKGRVKEVRVGLFGVYRQYLLVEGRVVHPGDR